MNRIFKISILAIPYIYFVFGVWVFGNWRATWVGVPLLLGYLIVTVAVYLPNMIYASLLSHTSDVSAEEILKFALLVKKVHIFFYVVIFLMGVIFALTVFGIAFLPVLFVMDYLLLLTTSAYSGCGIKKAVRDGKIALTDGLALRIMNFIFVLDLIGTAKAYKKIKVNKTN